MSEEKRLKVASVHIFRIQLQGRYGLTFEVTQVALNKPRIYKRKIVDIIKSLPFLFLPDQTV